MVATCFCFFACDSNEDAPLEYVCLDDEKILHIDNKCPDIFQIPHVGTKPVDVYPVSQIIYVYYRVCATCVDEKHYDELHVSVTTNLKKYYNLANSVYDNVPSYDEFVRYLESNSEAFYNDIVKNHRLPPYREFCREIQHPNAIAVDNQGKLYDLLHKNYTDIPEGFAAFQKSIGDTNTLRVYYDRIVRDDCALFLPEFDTLVVSLGLNPTHPAEKKLLL